MAWSIVEVGSNTTVASGNLALTVPASSANGDLLVAFIGNRGSATFTLPAGWSLAAQETSGDTAANGIAAGLIAYIVRGASAPSGTFTRTGGDLGFGRIVAYRGTNTPSFITSSSRTAASASTTIDAPSVSVNSGDLVCAVAASASTASPIAAFDAVTTPSVASSGIPDTTTDPTSDTWLRRSTTSSASGADGSFGIGDGLAASTGTTGTVSATGGSSRGAMVVAVFREAAPLNNYSLTAAAGSFTLSGQAASLKAGRSVTAAAGSFSLSGQAATLKAGRVLVSAAGSFTLSGQPATLYRAITLTAGPGSFTLSGQAASFGLTRTLTAGAGSFSLSGQAAAFAVTRVLSAGTGSFTLTGKAATLTRTGSYSLTCDTGDFTLSGQAAGLAATRLLTAAAGSFALSGQAASLTAGRSLAAGTGDYTLAGQDAGLTYTPNAGAYTLSAEAGVFTLNGQAAALAYVSNEAATQPTGGGGEFKPSKRLRQIERQRQKARKRLDDYLTRAFDLVDGTAPEDEAPESVAEQVIERLAVMPDPEALRLVAGIRAELAAMRQHAETLARIDAEQARLRDDDDAITALLLAA